MFLRDVKGQPVGCLAIGLDRKKHHAVYQLSVLNPADRFNRKMARHLALGRLMETPVSIPLQRGKDLTKHHISNVVMSHLAKSKAPTRAVKAAKQWLRMAQQKIAQKSVSLVTVAVPVPVSTPDSAPEQLTIPLDTFAVGFTATCDDVDLAQAKKAYHQSPDVLY